MTAEQIKQLNEVHAAIVGNKDLGQKGIIPRLEEVERYQNNDKIFKAKVAGGLAVGTPILVGLWNWILKHI